MTSPRSFATNWLTALMLPIAVASTSAASAQGFGPDPYRPYNTQYDSFVYPVAPGNGDVLPNEAALSRPGMSRNNQFQEYMQGIGNPGYQSQRRMDPESFRKFQYQPNRKVDEESGFYEKQESVSQAYFAYIRERDPKKRAELLREYQKVRSKPARDFVKSDFRRRGAQKANGEGDSATASRLDKPAPPRTRGSSDRSGTVPPPPSRSVRPGTGMPDSSRAAASARPSDVLEESLRQDRIKGPSEISGRTGGAPAPSSSRSRSGRIPPPPSRRSSSPTPGVE